jgi:predicted CoA-binding protein
MNPTVAVFEERVANLEGGAGAVAFASGIAAQAAALFTLLEPGDHVVSSAALYGGSVNQFKHLLRKMNVELTWVDPDDPDEWRKAVRANTKAFFGETIGNPAGNVLDIEALASIAHEHGLPLIVDNTFATPYLCRPIEWGADIVIHSATKFIGGHGTSIGGIVVEAGTFNWSNGRFPVVANPSPAYHGLQFHETFGIYGYLMKLRAETLRDLGAALAPFNALPLPARPRDTVATHGTPRPQRTRRGDIPRVKRARLERHLPRPTRKQIRVPRREIPATRSRRGVFVRLRRRTRRRTRADPKRHALVPPRQRRRRQEPHHPPRQHHPPPTQRPRTRGRRHSPRHDQTVRRHRNRQRPDLGPETRPRPAEMTWLEHYQDPLTIQRVLYGAQTIAIVGLSGNELRASNFVGYYLKRHGYRVIPVNPHETEILDETSYPSLAEVPVPVDIVNVFRTPDALPAIARDAVATQAGALWCQFDVINEEAARIADNGRVTVIMDRCLKVEHARYLGRMHWLGFNTGRITSIRKGLQ